jgi:ATP-dependent RNA helicase DeaD
VPVLESLHVSPSIAAALERAGWTVDDPMVKEPLPTAARGHNLLVVAPPAPAYGLPTLAGLMTRLGQGTLGVVLCPPPQLEEWGALANGLAGDAGLRVHVTHGGARTVRRLRNDSVDLLIASPEAALDFQGRSALHLERVTGILLAWPEQWQDEASLTPLMQDLSREIQRLVLTALPSRTADLVERYARRALTVGAMEQETAPIGPVRSVSVGWATRSAAIPELLELLDPASAVIWTADHSAHAAIRRVIAATEPETRLTSGDAPRADLILAFDLPTARRLQQLRDAGEVVLLVPPGAESYVSSIAGPIRPLRLSGLVDRVASEAGARRRAIVQTLESAPPERALLTLAPLFERYDPSAIAAALFELWVASAHELPIPRPEVPAVAKIYVGIGKRDGATVNDLVAVLTKEVRVDRAKIGRVELRDSYTLVEIPAQDAESVASALNGKILRRKRVTARVDRGRPSRESQVSGRKSQVSGHKPTHPGT